MKNKINKKTLIFIIITSVVSLGLFGLLLKYQYRTYTINYNNKINSIIFVVLSLLCLILNFSLKKMKNTDMWDIELEGIWLDIHTK